jgi:hypothetical protein
VEIIGRAVSPRERSLCTLPRGDFRAAQARRSRGRTYAPGPAGVPPLSRCCVSGEKRNYSKRDPREPRDGSPRGGARENPEFPFAHKGLFIRGLRRRGSAGVARTRSSLPSVCAGGGWWFERAQVTAGQGSPGEAGEKMWKRSSLSSRSAVGSARGTVAGRGVEHGGHLAD